MSEKLGGRDELPGDHGPTFDLDAESAEAGGIVCVLHASHSPANLTLEYHHVIPVAWQLFYDLPAPQPHEGVDPDGRGRLWDARTMPVCPTDHRNVHALIVEMMHADGDVQARSEAIKHHRSGKTLEAAMQGLSRFEDAGGSLTSLAAAGKWGEA